MDEAANPLDTGATQQAVDENGGARFVKGGKGKGGGGGGQVTPTWKHWAG